MSVDKVMLTDDEFAQLRKEISQKKRSLSGSFSVITGIFSLDANAKSNAWALDRLKAIRSEKEADR